MNADDRGTRSERAHPDVGVDSRAESAPGLHAAAAPNPDALLPQEHQYQVVLYDWLETVSIQDVRLPNQDLQWDGTYQNENQLADIWLQFATRGAASLSRVTRAQPRWYVLDDGRGGGIEGSGTVRLMHYTGHDNHRSWANEPAYWYQLKLPMSNGSSGNPYYRNSALAYRALVLTAVDMMMYDREADKGNYANWNDMYGKALLAWAEAYDWTRDVLNSRQRQAFEDGFQRFLRRTIRNGPRDANTNMDMFTVHAAARIYTVTSDSDLKQDCLQAVKRILFGYADGSMGSRHNVERGTFFPAGYIGENSGPEVFYNGESLYQLVGAYNLVQQHGSWQFLEDVVRRMLRFKMYQMLPDPQGYHNGPSGFSNRTSATTVADQNDTVWRDLTAAALFDVAHPLVRRPKWEDKILLKTPSAMARSIRQRVSELNSAQWGSTYGGNAPEWNGWSPWVKMNPYVPPSGWYSSLRELVTSNAPSLTVPFDRDGYEFNIPFGGPPTGNEFWAYKGDDGGREWGFFVEADAQQGRYGGWYGGKLEQFWTESTGTVIINRHGKTGCDPSDAEDSLCWDLVEKWGAHHVWGIDENGNAFSTSQMRGLNLTRSSTFDVNSSRPTVSVTNVFNDPNQSRSYGNGEQGRDVIQGTFSVTNRFEALSNGVRVSHELKGDGSDQVRQVWATIPVHLKDAWRNTPSTTIEYLDGSNWRSVGENRVTTSKLRLGRSFGSGTKYVYVVFDNRQAVRLSSEAYQDPYQTNTRIRGVHIDLHGNPGSVASLPQSKTISYAITTSSDGGSSGGGGGSTPVSGTVQQSVALSQGWNTVSLAVVPADKSVANLVSGVSSSIETVESQDGAAYDPDNGNNEIGQWSVDEGYRIYARESATLRVDGTRIDPSLTSITLERGWNLVPYWPKTAMAPREALSSIRSDVVMVKDDEGRMYHPGYGIDEIGRMEPGEGYKIYVDEPCSLTYPVQ